MEKQVKDNFLPNAGRKPSWAPWKSDNSLFSINNSISKTDLVTWIGINDITRGLDLHAQLTLLFQLQESLFQAGARNFVFLTVPPFERAPWGKTVAFLCGR